MHALSEPPSQGMPGGEGEGGGGGGDGDGDGGGVEGDFPLPAAMSKSEKMTCESSIWQ